MSQPFLSAIDIGFMYTKGIVNGKRIIIKSVVGESKDLQFGELNMNAQNYLITDDYFVSDFAIEQSDTVYYSLRPNRFDSDSTKILINTLFGLGFGKGQYNTYIVSGLPVSHYSRFRSDIQKLFMGIQSKMHSYRLKTNPTDPFIQGSVVTLDGKFIPQPFGVLVNELLDDEGNIKNKDIAQNNVAVIDIGFGTTDVYVAKSLSPIEKLSFSTNTAMNHVYRMIGDRISTEFETNLAMHELEDIVKKGYFKRFGKTYDLSKIIEWAKYSTSDQLSSEILNKWGDTWDIDAIVIAGGGGIALGDYLGENFSHFNKVYRPEDSQWAVVNGYYKWGKRTWKDRLGN